ncbi:MAG: carboxypeptidase regulatory-like domain-containing protein [Spirochaetales bacterium]|nr:MAG: carboxypeptidase regulatory-like domain-containing protein [Spirochaetales bacterium]
MKRNLILKLALLALSVFLIVGVTSCDFFSKLFSLLAAPQGYVVVAQTGVGLANATVTLTPKAQIVPPQSDSKTQEKIATNEAARVVLTATTDADGYYTFADVDFGNYVLTATATGYGCTKQIVNVSGLAQYLPSVAALPDDSQLRIVTMWSPDFKDIDVAITYDASYADGSVAAFTDNYQTSTATAGFTPESGATGREKVFYGLTGSTDKADGVSVVSLDIDNRGRATDIAGGPETITIKYIPDAVTPVGTSFTVDDAHALWSKLPVDATNSYSWCGAMEFYVDAYSRSSDTTADDATLVTADGSADAALVVYVMKGKDMLGAYTLPEFTVIDSASILRINTFLLSDATGTQVFQIIPDIRIMNGQSSFRDLGMPEDGIIVVSSPGRN